MDQTRLMEAERRRLIHGLTRGTCVDDRLWLALHTRLTGLDAAIGDFEAQERALAGEAMQCLETLVCPSHTSRDGWDWLTNGG